MTKQIITLILAVVVAFVPLGAFAAPGDDPEPEMRAYVTTDGNTALLLMRVEMDGRSEAALMVAFMDDTTLEDVLDLTVLQSETFDRDAQRALGVDSGALYAVHDRDLGAGLVVVAADGRDVYVLAMFGDDLDGEAFFFITQDAIANDLDVELGRGWMELDMDDEPSFVTGSL